MHLTDDLHEWWGWRSCWHLFWTTNAKDFGMCEWLEYTHFVNSGLRINHSWPRFQILWAIPLALMWTTQTSRTCFFQWSLFSEWNVEREEGPLLLLKEYTWEDNYKRLVDTKSSLSCCVECCLNLSLGSMHLPNMCLICWLWFHFF